MASNMVNKKLMYTKAGIVDRIPQAKIDEDKLVKFLIDRKTIMSNDRQNWLDRQDKYLSNWDDYVTYPRKGMWDESSNLHMPITMQMGKALHARIKQAIFAIHLPFNTIPLEKLDLERLKTIDTLMKWAIYNYANYWKGIVNVVDDWIWDFVFSGWGVTQRRWDRLERKAIVVEELKQDKVATEAVDQVAEILAEEMPADKKNEALAKEVEKIIPYFDGPVIETVAHEDIWFPGRMQDVSDLNEPDVVAVSFDLSASQMKARVAAGIYQQKNGEEIIAKGKGRIPLVADTRATKKKEKEDKTQGVESINSEIMKDKYRMTNFFARYDVDGDGIDEELVVTLNEETQTIARWTYLDRITKTGQRPLHKADMIRRPRRAYSIGLVELLYPINNEIDSMHNMKVDVNTITNIPFFFYRSTCGLKPEKIKLEPGVGIPLDDPQDVNFPRFNNQSQFTMTEEQSLIAWAERLTSLTTMNMGLPSPAVGASRTAEGMQRLLNEGNINIDVILDRFKIAYVSMLKGLLSDMQERLPDDVKVRVCGANGETLYQNGQPWIVSVTREDIGGKVDFIMTANSSNSNRELEYTKAVSYSQLLLNPVNLQAGVIQPGNVYNIMRNILEKGQVVNLDDFLTKPASVPMPLSLYDEIAAVTQGLVPRIVMNDNHRAKVQGLLMWSQEPVFLAGIAKGVNAPNALEALSIAVETHSAMQAAIDAQAAPAQNVTGMQVSPTAGANMAALKGGVNGPTGNRVTTQGTQGNPAMGGAGPVQGGGGQ